MPCAESSSARVRRSLGSFAENETSLWWRSGYCDVHTDDMAPSVYTAGVYTRSNTTPSDAIRSISGVVGRAYP